MEQKKQFRELSPVIISRSRKLRLELTEPEKRLWYRLNLCQLNGHKFRRQHPIGNYITDFACIEKKLIVELDGDSHASQTDYDKERDAFLRKLGYTVLRFWNNEAMKNIDGVLAVISEQLEK